MIVAPDRAAGNPSSVVLAVHPTVLGRSADSPGPVESVWTPVAGRTGWDLPAPVRTMTASRFRLLVVAVLLVGAAVAAVLLPVPTPLQMRAWAESVGTVAPVLFLCGHTVLTMAPVPRTVFTLAAGLLFGPALGVTLSLLATTLSAALAFTAVRWLGRDLVAPWLDRRALRAVDARLRHRGWLAVASLRLIPAVPFAVLNYCSAVSSIPLRHFLIGTVGIVPGSVAVVVLGDALTGRTSPALLAVSLGCAAIGILGLVVQARSAVPPALARHPAGTEVNPVSSPPRPSPGTTAPRRRRSAPR